MGSYALLLLLLRTSPPRPSLTLHPVSGLRTAPSASRTHTQSPSQTQSALPRPCATKRARQSALLPTTTTTTTDGLADRYRDESRISHYGRGFLGCWRVRVSLETCVARDLCRSRPMSLETRRVPCSGGTVWQSTAVRMTAYARVFPCRGSAVPRARNRRVGGLLRGQYRHYPRRRARRPLARS